MQERSYGTPHTQNELFAALTEAINRFPQGAPENKTLLVILKNLVSEKKAELVATLPFNPFTVEKAKLFLIRTGSTLFDQLVFLLVLTHEVPIERDLFFH